MTEPASVTTCAVCGAGVNRVVHHFPSRRAPWNRPFVAAPYFRDPFWGRGNFEEYCSAACSAAGHAREEAR